MEVTAHLTHGVGLYLYIADEDVSVGSSWSTHLLLQTLDYVKQACARKGTKMPEHFHLQCDNTSRELKNSIAMKVVACLIQQNFFSPALSSSYVWDIPMRTLAPILSNSVDVVSSGYFHNSQTQALKYGISEYMTTSV